MTSEIREKDAWPTRSTDKTEAPAVQIQALDERDHAGRHRAEQPSPSVYKALGVLDRWLAVWILLAMAVGIILGRFVPGTARALEKGKFVGVSIPIAVGLLVMMYPILCKVRFESLHELASSRHLSKQIGFSVVVNWLVAPLLMLALAWAFLPDEEDLRTGLILVGLGRCIAMVLIWNSLAGGQGEYCVILVAVNSLLQIILFAPMAILFIRVISNDRYAQGVSYSIVARSVAAFLGIPLGAAVVSRFGVRAVAGVAWYEGPFLAILSPWSLIGLLYTIVVLFASQGSQVVRQIVSVIRVAAPLLAYFVIVFFSTVFICRAMGFPYTFLVTQSFTAASNNFELAIAVAVATFGPDSEQALASTVGPLIEVPVLLALVYTLRWMAKRWDWK